MSFKPIWKWTAVVAALLAVAAGAAMGASIPAQWQNAAATTGMRCYAWAAEITEQFSLVFVLPIIAMTMSFRAGNRIAGRLARRRDARVIAATAPSYARYAILFGVTALMSLVMIALYQLR